MAKPMLPDALTRAQAAALLPLNIAARLVEYIHDAQSGQFILNVQKGRIMGARVECVVKVLDNGQEGG